MNKQSECKYRILAEAKRKGHKIYYDVLYDASSVGYDNITEEIGSMESEFIHRYKPMLNT